MKNEPRIIPIPPMMIGDMWPHVVPHLIKGLTKATDLTLRQVADDLVAGSDQLWCVIWRDKVVAAFLTSVFEDDADQNRRYLGVYALGGEGIEAWGKLLGEKMIEAAKSAGCASVRFTGREAWSRVLPAYRTVGRRGSEAVFERAVQ